MKKWISGLIGLLLVVLVSLAYGTVDNDHNRVDYDPDGGVSEFTYDFRVDAADDLVVYEDGVVVIGGYSVTGVGSETGGSVVFDTPPAASVDVLTLIREVDATQLTAYPAYGKFPAAAHEKALDKLTFLAQQHEEQMSRTATAPIDADPEVDWTLPDYAPGLFWAWDAGEKRLVNTTISEAFYRFNWTENTLAALQNREPEAEGEVVYVKGRTSDGDGYQGIFVWSTADLSAEVTADTLSGIYVAPTSDPTGASGAWVRQDMQRSSRVASGSSVVDIHYGALKGTGYITGEAGGSRAYNVVSGVFGSKTITLSANADITYGANPLIIGQLICYKGASGDYYTTRIKNIVGAVLTVTDANIEEIQAGNNLFNFYANSAHPNIYGYNAIADSALREIKSKDLIVDRANLVVNLSATVIPIATDTLDNPGSSTVSALAVTCPTSASDGVGALLTSKATGAHEVHIKVNTLGNDVTLLWTNDGAASSITVNNDTPQLYKLPLYIFNTSNTPSVFISTVVNGETFYIVEEVVLVKIDPANINLNGGTHVFLGDSWISQLQIVARMSEKLPRATLINKGVGGNTIEQSVARFHSDATPHSPDFVWLLDGTNDWSVGTTPKLFSYQVNKFKTLCANINAHAIIMTSSVASVDVEGAAKFDLSRRYLSEVFYYDEDLARPVAEYETGVWSPVVTDGPTGNIASVSSISGSYTKIGNMVTVWFTAIDIDTTGLTSTNWLHITGLPYVMKPVTLGIAPGSLTFTSITHESAIVPIINSNTDYILLRDSGDVAGAGGNIRVSGLTSGVTDINGCITYRVN